MSFELTNGITLDGYQLIRLIGSGGFGEVWLCRSEAMGDYRAIKFISTHDSDKLDKEYQALIHYRKAVSQLRSPQLVSIEHVNRNEAGLYYVMPLADGSGAEDPSDPAWTPLSLSCLIAERSETPAWFSSREIISLIEPILQALQTLSNAGLIHRDVKPENILFFNGQPCLGDISLLGLDASVITRRGTPGYATPSWYVGGHPDMYGVAATLYTLLTGNAPDRMGRAAFIWPPQGESSLSEGEGREWKRLHSVIRRATDEKVSERYLDFRTMAESLSGSSALLQGSPGPEHSFNPTKTKKHLALASIISLILIGIGIIWFQSTDRDQRETASKDTKISGNQSDGSLDPDKDVQPDNEASEMNSRFTDAQNAYGVLMGINLSDAQYDGKFSDDEVTLYYNTINHFYLPVSDINTFNPEQALRTLDTCLNAVEKLKEIPNVRLAQLLALRATGDTKTIESEISSPVYLTPDKRDFDDRAFLLTQLGAADKAEIMLSHLVDEKSLTTTQRTRLFLSRAKVRIHLGKYPEAHADVSEAISVVHQDPVKLSNLTVEIQALEARYPEYSAYLKANAEK